MYDELYELKNELDKIDQNLKNNHLYFNENCLNCNDCDFDLIKSYIFYLTKEKTKYSYLYKY